MAGFVLPNIWLKQPSMYWWT